MARRTERMPRAAIARTLARVLQAPDEESASTTSPVRCSPACSQAAQERGELPADADPLDVADMLNALMITAVEGWVHGAYPKLAPELAYRVRVLFAGVRADRATAS